MNYPSDIHELNLRQIEYNQIVNDITTKMQKDIEQQIFNAFKLPSDLLTGTTSSTYTSAKLQADMHKAMLPRIQVVECKWMTDKKQIRRHRSKRINKKWNKKYGCKFIDVPKQKVYYFENKIIGHPKMLKKIIEQYKQI